MISIISPAKTLDFTKTNTSLSSQPLFKKESGQLARSLSRKSVIALEKLMNISKDLARTNAQRYSEFKEEPDPTTTKQAILAFKGDVYRGINAESFSTEELMFVQDHVRILSGMYGLLNPMDLIQPYRLEMGTRMKIGRKKNLYEFWADKITTYLNSEIERTNAKSLLNLASKEYFSAVQADRIKIPIVHIHFLENREGELKFVSFNAKKARGMMIHYIVTKCINDLESVKGFDMDEYTFSSSKSDDRNYTFIR